MINKFGVFFQLTKELNKIKFLKRERSSLVKVDILFPA